MKTIDIPVLHIADATAEVLIDNGIKKVGLLGTSFTMEHEFYKGRLSQKYGLDILIPSEEDRKIVHGIIYQELCLGKIIDKSKADYLRIIDNLANEGTEKAKLALKLRFYSLDFFILCLMFFE